VVFTRFPPSSQVVRISAHSSKVPPGTVTVADRLRISPVTSGSVWNIHTMPDTRGKGTVQLESALPRPGYPKKPSVVTLI
jgi:hypothetical protein